MTEKKARIYAENVSDTVRKEIALTLINKGVDMDTIAEATLLPIDELTRIYHERKLI